MYAALAMRYHRPLGHLSAGAEGFEPPNGGIKTRSLTAWRCPMRFLYTLLIIIESGLICQIKSDSVGGKKCKFSQPFTNFWIHVVSDVFIVNDQK